MKSSLFFPVAAAVLLFAPFCHADSPDDAKLDLSSLTRDEIPSAIEEIASLPGIELVDLGEESEAEGSLTLEDVGEFQEEFPDIDFEFRFDIFGQEVSTLCERLNLNHIEMDDEGAAVRRALPYLRHCRYLNMDMCGVSSKAMAAIRDDFPEIEVVWRVFFGSDCGVRTDCERILASNTGHGLTDANSKDLMYCTKVKYLDVGHQYLRDLSFLQYMPDLEVCIIALNPWSDLSPVSGCTKLEYLEIEYTGCSDLSPLSTLTELEHLNIGGLGKMRGCSSLLNLTKLKRLMVTSHTTVPGYILNQLRELNPDIEIDTEAYDASAGTWRVDPATKTWSERYQLLRDQFGYSNYGHTCASFMNDKRYYYRYDD